MPDSGRSSSASSRCRIEWRPSRTLCAGLLVFSVLAAFAVLASEMPRVAAWPLALLAAAHGAGLAWRQMRQPRRWFEFAGQDRPVRMDDRQVRDASVTWRGPLAFVRWRDPAGRARHLAWWPDTLGRSARRELRLAAPLRRAARRTDSVAP